VSFELGLNAPWVDCGWDFGPAPPGWDLDGSHRASWRTRMTARVRETRALGLPLLRWFVLANGANLAPTPRWDVGARRWRWIAAPLDERFFADLAALLDVCAAEGVTLLPALTSFGMFEHRDDVFAERAKAAPTRGVPGLRAAALCDPEARAAFETNVIAPLIRFLATRARQLRAVEIINEPEWATRGALHGDARTESVPVADMLAFIRATSTQLRAAGLDASVGFVRYATNSSWDAISRLSSGAGLGLALGQVHHYPTARERLPLHDSQRGACLVGELATRFDVLPRWPDVTGVDSLSARIAHIEASGYAGALLWSAQPRSGATWPDRATQWDESVRVEVREIATRISRRGR